RRVGELFDDLGALGAGVAVGEGAKRVCGGKADGRRAGGAAVVLEDFAGFSDQVADAGGGDFEQVGEHVHGACLPLVEEGEQDAGGIVEQRLAAAYLAAGPAGPAATLLAVALLGAGWPDAGPARRTGRRGRCWSPRSAARR